MIIIDCPACMVGEHSKHIEHWGTRPEGVIDGEFCHCTGDCKERLEARFQEMANLFAPVPPPHGANDAQVLSAVAGAEHRYTVDAEFHAKIEIVTRVLDLRFHQQTGMHMQRDDTSLARQAAIVALTINDMGWPL
jgi:hypothetical protein